MEIIFLISLLFFSDLFVYRVKRPFSKMAVENSNKSQLKAYTSTGKNTFTLVTLQSFSWENVGRKLRNLQTLVCNLLPRASRVTGRMHYTPSHTNVRFLNFRPTFSQLMTPEMLKLCKVNEVKVFFLVLVYIFNLS